MNASTSLPDEGKGCAACAPFHGTAWAWREEIAELAWRAGVETGLLQTYATVGDDAGLEYATRRLTAYTKAILDFVLELRVPKVREGRE